MKPLKTINDLCSMVNDNTLRLGVTDNNIHYIKYHSDNGYIIITKELFDIIYNANIFNIYKSDLVKMITSKRSNKLNKI